MKAQSLHKVRELLDALERTAGEPGDLTGTLQHIAQTAQKFFAADACVIFAINPITNRFIASLTTAGDLLEEQVSFEQPRAEGIAPEVLMRGVLVVENLEAEPQYQSKFTRAEAIRSFVGLALQIQYRQKPLGVVYLNFRQKQQFSADDHELFQIFAEQASYILQETWLLRRYQEVVRIGHEINQELATVDILFEKLRKHIAGIVDTSHALLLAVYYQQTNTFDLYLEENGHTILQADTPLGGACHYVIETQKPLVIPQLSNENAELLPFQLIPIRGNISEESFIFMPLVLRGVSLGVLSIQHPQPNAYNQEDQFILELLANHIALALHNIRLHGSLNQLNETGQMLTQVLESEQTLQTTVDKIRDATRADLVVLYPYEPTLRRFLLPPRTAGELLGSTIQSMYPDRPDDITTLMLRHVKPIFAKKGAAVYTELHGSSHIQQGSFGQHEHIHSTAALPLRVGNESVGVLFVNFRQPQRFDATQKLLIEGLAHYAAIAIKNAQAFGSLAQRRVRELEILQKIDRELSRTLDLSAVLDTILRLGHEHVPVEEASILLHESQAHTLETKAALGRHAEASRTQVISLHKTKAITRWVLEHKRPIRVNNVHRELPWRELHFPVAADTISELDVPMLDGDEVVGILNFESTREGAFGEEEELFLVTLAGQAVLAIKKAQAYEREKRLAEEGRALNQISKEITSQLDLNRVFDLILEKALELTHSTRGNLMLYDYDRNDLWMAAERGVTGDKKGQRQSLDQGIVGYAARNKQLLNIDLSQPPWNDVNLDFFPGTRSELAVPMLVGDGLHGVLNVESFAPNNYSERDERLLQGLADLAVIALQNAQTYEREKRLAAEARVLNEISQEIATQLDPVNIFHLILKKALELTRTTVGSLHLYDPDLRDLYMVAEYGVIEEKKGQRQKLGVGIVGYAAAQKQLCNVEDVSLSPWNEVYIQFFPGVRSEVAVPMLEGNDLRGVLNVESLEPSHFEKSDERILKGLADLAVVALQSTERYKKASREAQHSKMLYQAGRELAKITDLEQLEQAYDIILRIAEEHSPCQVVIRRYDDNTQELVLIRASQYQGIPPFPRMKLGEGLNGQVARERRTIVIYDTLNPPPSVALKLSDIATRSLVITPIQFKDRYYGNLGLGHREVGYFRGGEIGFFEGLADQLASTIYRLENAKERQEFEKISSFGQSAFELTHRLANDLGLVEFYVDDIQRQMSEFGIADKLVTENLNDIVQSVKRVLSFSVKLKQELDKQAEDEPVLISPQELLKEVMVVPSLPPNIYMSLNIDDGVGPVRIIRSQVADILRNLVTNAIDAMPNGGKITLQARSSGRFVALEVIDTGIGIPAQEQEKIFDLSYSPKGSSGFGLWSALRNARRNHGELKVESRPGHTMFTLLLPRTDGGTV